MIRYVVGIDEVGRGPLAGPVTVAALAAPNAGSFFRGIKDSKKLSKQKREEWFSLFKNNPKLKYSVSSVGHSVIDKRGIAYAARLAVKRCLEKLNRNYGLKTINYKLYLDGSLYAPPEFNQKTIIRGDEKVPIIAAASIIAKVNRDRKMIRLAKKYPKYSFEIHKGYSTKLHMRLVKKHGLCDIHRRSFCSKFV